MKKFICLVMLLVLAWTAIPNSYASASDTYKIYVNDTRLSIDDAMMVDGRLFLPIRLINTVLGDGEVTWDDEAQSATMCARGSKFEFFTKSGVLEVDGNEVESDLCLFFVSKGQIYLQTRLFVPFLGASIKWDGSTGSVYITKDGANIPETMLYVEPPVQEPVKEPAVVKSTSYSQDDLYWLSRLVQAEAGGESFEGKLAVANVVMNRVKSGYYPSTVKGVIFDGIQFSPTLNGTIYNNPGDESIQAAIKALEGDNNISTCLYFTGAKAKSWASKNRKLYKIIGQHAFYY